MGTKLSIYYERGIQDAPHLFYDAATKTVTLSFFTPDYEGGGNWFSVDLPNAMCDALADYVAKARENAATIPPCPQMPRKLRMKTTVACDFKVGDTVIVNDRHRLAVPHIAKIISIDDSRGVSVEFLEDTPQVKSWRASRDAHEQYVRDVVLPGLVDNREFFVDISKIEFCADISQMKFDLEHDSYKPDPNK